MKKVLLFCAAVSALAIAAPVAAQQTTVTTLENGSFPSTHDGTTFTASSAELSQNRPGGVGTSSATITADTTLDANGSLQLSGDRSRVYNDLTGLNFLATDLESLTANYLVTNGGNGGIQSPAFRVYVQGANGQISELIWEAAYNGGYTVGQSDSLSATDQFWRYITNTGFDGTGGIGQGSYVMHTLGQWGDLLGGTVLGIGVGQGGGAGINFKAYVDDLTLTRDNASRTTNVVASYDFAAGAVPEPATWAMMLLGFGGIGAAMRRQRKPAPVAQIA